MESYKIVEVTEGTGVNRIRFPTIILCYSFFIQGHGMINGVIEGVIIDKKPNIFVSNYSQETEEITYI